jgi:subtilisin family serine protease
MIRRIVLTRRHEWLRAAWNTRSFAAAGPQLETTLKVRGMSFDETYHPVRVPGQPTFKLDQARALGFDYRNFANVAQPATYSLRAEFEDEEAIARFKADRGQEIVGVYADPAIRPFPSYCGDGPVGTHKQVARKLGVSRLKRAGLTGKRVRVAVVDTGIDGTRIAVAGGWSPIPGAQPGTSPPDHGTMVAFDVRIAAPDAAILDYALLQSTGHTWTAFLSDAIAAFADLIALLQREPGPLVVNNSWGMFDRAEDAPIGAPDNYSANPDHPFNQIVGSLVGAGADVCFAAGNCGRQCPDDRCGAEDVGPGQSIHGANSHPDVLTVAAVTVDHRRLGYSSQGPGGLHKRKPDLAGYSHFAGSGVFEVDGGTSAASPVVAGVVAALRQKAGVKKYPPAALKGLLQRTARDVDGDGWDFDLGYGIIRAPAAAKALKLTAAPKAAAAKAAAR